jgi:hypothetical protein
LDYYWSRDWHDWRSFSGDDERAEASEARLEVRRRLYPISPRKPLPPYVRSPDQAAWEKEQCGLSNARRFRELKRGFD